MDFRRFSLSIIFFCLQIVCFAYGTGKMTIRGNECNYDTLIFRTIAPGANLTQYQFNNIQIGDAIYKMKAHVISIDLTNPYNMFTPYISKDTYFAVNSQTAEVKERAEKAQNQGLNLRPVASINGGGFVQSNYSGTTSDAYEISGSLVEDGEIKYESYGSRINCYVDGDKVSHIGSTALKGTLTADGKSFAIGQVNHYRDVVDGKELITLFCNGMGKSRAAKSNTGTDVRVKIVNGTKVLSNKDIQCEVIGVTNYSNNIFEEGEAILSGVGKAAEFLKTLKVGESVTINLSYVDANNATVDVQNQITNLFGYCIKDGVVQPFETKDYAIAAIGNSQDGNTVYWADLEISRNSNAPCICLSDLLQNIGVYDAMWLDGGPSAEMTVNGEFITTNSIPGFNGRYIPSGFILYSTAPEENTLSSINVLDKSKRILHKGETTTIHVEGYNKYGVLVLSDAENSSSVEFSCTNNLGTIKNGTFIAENYGDGYITIKLVGSNTTISIPVSVVEKCTLTAYPQNIFTGEGRQCQIKLTYTDDNGTREINPSDAAWTKAGRYVLSSCDNGLIIPYGDGYDNVYVSYNGVCDTIGIEVENLEEEVQILDLSNQIADESDICLPSVPESFTVDITGMANSEVSVNYGTGYDEIPLTASGIIGSDGTLQMTIPLDYDAVETYPVVFFGIDGMSAELKHLYANYKTSAGIGTIMVNDDNAKQRDAYNLAGQRVLPDHFRGILIKGGKKMIMR